MMPSNRDIYKPEPLVAPTLPEGYFFRVRPRNRFTDDTEVKVSLRKRMWGLSYEVDYWYAAAQRPLSIKARMDQLEQNIGRKAAAKADVDAVCGNYPPKTTIG